MGNRGAKMGISGMLKEMFTDTPEEMVSTEEVDAKLLQEEIDEKGEDLVLLEEEEDKVVDYIEAGSERALLEEEDARRTMKKMLQSVVGLCVILLLGCIFTSHPARYALGVAIGCGLSVLFLIWMFRSVERSLSGDKDASRYMRAQAGLRYLVCFLVLAAAGYLEKQVWPNEGNALLFGAIFGLLTVKIAAFIYPLLERFRK